MPEEQNKKIKFKILTAEELLKEETSPTKEISYEEEKINIPITEKFEVKKTPTSSQDIQEKKETIKIQKEIQKETDLVYHQKEKSKEIFLPEIKTAKEVGPSKIELTSLQEKPIETKPIVKKEETKKSAFEEIFYKPTKKEKELIKPETETLKEKTKEEKQKQVLKSSSNLFKYIKIFLIGSGIILIGGLIIFFKPYEKLKSFLPKEKTKEENEITAQTQVVQTSTIIFPTLTVTSTEVTTQPGTPIETSTLTGISVSTETTASKETTITLETSLEYPLKTQTEIATSDESNILKETSTLRESVSRIVTSSLSETISLTETPLSEFPVSGEIQFLKNFTFQEIRIQDLNFQTFQKEFNNFLTKQEVANTKIYLRFLYGDRLVPLNFILDYFIKPTKISTTTIESFKNELVGTYGFLLYYGYTRKYPLLIFEIKDKGKVEKFNWQWEKLSMKDDLQTLFLGDKPPKTKNNFITKRIANLNYRILDFGNNYKIIWVIVDSYLIYSTTETGLQEIINYLK